MSIPAALGELAKGETCDSQVISQKDLKFHPQAFALIWPALGSDPEKSQSTELPVHLL